MPLMENSRILVILPALDEGRSIDATLRGIHEALPQADTLVIDDGSRDDTAAAAQAAGAKVLRMPYNVGIGAAVQAGFQFAARQGYTIVLRNDGDGQHAPQNNPQLLAALSAGTADIVIGSRFVGAGDYGTPRLRRLGSAILARLLSLIIRQRITDPTSGCAAFNQRAIALFASAYPHDYPEPEAILIAWRSGLRQIEAPAQMMPRQHGSSSITPIRSVYYMVKVILAILIELLRKTPSA
ncbi:MAG: glycosyltransferase family 2 protein [Chloroflexi bacterium]|nr:glycosyltransferase family 2 protein [Chloroflexota bacterium]MXX83592.1 glycosyltransferase family 2 protein [Chloroflexota bacterium]MYA93789.1 glycosyltransferase family 2 protein [Chloroflexota bacterium]MYC54880.1 glycosyltransferase family 2 protein [Chloroflexota bacterium]MYD37393.1 glycosyltransferase family 2 protein [Chloroflexota bacterium]